MEDGWLFRSWSLLEGITTVITFGCFGLWMLGRLAGQTEKDDQHPDDTEAVRAFHEHTKEAEAMVQLDAENPGVGGPRRS